MRPNANRRFFPIGLGIIHTIVNDAGYNPELLDLDANPQSSKITKEYLKNNHYDVVLMGCIVTGFDKIKWISDYIRSVHSKTIIIVGNTVASSVPKLLLEHTSADIAVMGEGDITILELLCKIKDKEDYSGVPGIVTMLNGKIKKSVSRPVIKDIDSVKLPDWDLFDIDTYIGSQSENLNEPLPPIPRDQIKSMVINTARGCPYSCTFCYHAFIGTKYRYRSAKSIICEMRHLKENYGINTFSFNDEMTFITPRQTNEFAEALIESNLNVWFEADCRSGLLKKEEHLEIAYKLKKAGCLSLAYSLESANTDILIWMDKNLGPDNFLKQSKILEKVGIATLTSVVFGYPNETKETIAQTIDVCIEANVYPSAGYLLPQPGTPMYDYALKHGYITDEYEYVMKIGDRQDLWMNMTNMSDDELKETVGREMQRCATELELGLHGDSLLKTGHYKIPKSKKEIIFDH